MEKRPEVEVSLGGENACYAHLLCQECGAVLDDSHEQHCSLREASGAPER